jgi:hypothetical protein
MVFPLSQLVCVIKLVISAILEIEFSSGVLPIQAAALGTAKWKTMLTVSTGTPSGSGAVFPSVASRINYLTICGRSCEWAAQYFFVTLL